MSDEPALLRAIVESPDDLTLRLIYADWCEEHGRAARSALIRGQCLLDPLIVSEQNEYGEPGFDARYLAPFQLTAELRAALIDPFRPLAGMPGWLQDDEPEGLFSPRNPWYNVRRGFVERLNIQGLIQFASWIEHAATLLERVPILSLNVWRDYASYPGGSDHLPADIVRQLVTVKGIERLRELNMSGFMVGRAAAVAFVEGEPKLRLTSLQLSERSLGRVLRDALRGRFGDALILQHHPRSGPDDIPF